MKIRPRARLPVRPGGDVVEIRVRIRVRVAKYLWAVSRVGPKWPKALNTRVQLALSRHIGTKRKRKGASGGPNPVLKANITMILAQAILFSEPRPRGGTWFRN